MSESGPSRRFAEANALNYFSVSFPGAAEMAREGYADALVENDPGCVKTLWGQLIRAL
jgi:hypothetical protein